MIIYFSPHNDDICFSIGHLAGRLGGELINLFTLSRYIARPMNLPPDAEGQVAVITRLRREEDEKFAHAAGLRRHDLGLPEPRLRGRASFDLSDLPQDVQELSTRLIPYLLSLLPPDSRPETAALYCPMGIGGHRNHVCTLLAIRDAFPVLSSRCSIYLYEDLHYASRVEVRQIGLDRAARAFSGIPFVREVLPLEPLQAEQKMDWVGLYASQHPQRPEMTDFTPASGVSGPHEIVWRLTPPGPQQ